MLFFRMFIDHRAVVLLREVALKIRRCRRRRSLVAAFCGISMLRTMYWGLRRPSCHRQLVVAINLRAQLGICFDCNIVSREEEEGSNMRKFGSVMPR
jgi:hypothetical protein